MFKVWRKLLWLGKFQWVRVGRNDYRDIPGPDCRALQAMVCKDLNFILSMVRRPLIWEPGNAIIWLRFLNDYSDSRWIAFVGRKWKFDHQVRCCCRGQAKGGFLMTQCWVVRYTVWVEVSESVDEFNDCDRDDPRVFGLSLYVNYGATFWDKITWRVEMGY